MPGVCVPRTPHLEFEKHNKELKRVRKYLWDKSPKTDFEIYLMKNYDYFLNLALQMTEELRFFKSGEVSRFTCHGDYQHHNIMFARRDYLINLKNVFLTVLSGICTFYEKLMEKITGRKASALS